MPSASGLSPGNRLRARERATQAATLALHHSAQIHYTDPDPPPDPLRWEGIDKRRNARLGQFPKNGDCSSFVTWCLWNALFLGFNLGDIVNGAGWTGGYTGTLRSHGLPVQHEANLLRGDLVHYGPGTGSHVTIVVGRQGGVPMVVSHGSEDCPCYTKYDYRSDVAQFRRYI
jgi:cell wall-associated NlpC family hydrolase